MRKIPTIYQRDPDDMRWVTSEWHPDCGWVARGEGIATRKYDGTCVLIRRDGLAVRAFARREVKKGKTPPPGFVEEQFDPNTGKRVGWEPADQSGFAKFITEAVEAAGDSLLPGTYELCGPKIQGNPEGFASHVLVRHADAERAPHLDAPPPIETLGKVLHALAWEGIVWHHPDGRMAKIKARDFPPVTAQPSGAPILIDCEGSGCPPASPLYPICAMCGQHAPLDGEVVVPHQRDDVLARLTRGDFDA